ncbi:Colicin-M [compost metagenome]
MAIELPPMIIYPDDYGTARSIGSEPPFPAAMVGRMITERSDAYAKGHWREMMTLHLPRMKYTRPTPYYLDDFLQRELITGSKADAMMLKSPAISFTDAWNKSFSGFPKASEMAVPIEFSGGIYTPFKAIGHWLLGKGKKAKVNIKNIGISPSPQKIPQLKSAIDKAVVGKSSIDITVPYNTGADNAISRIYLGSITIRVTGDVIKSSDGAVSFKGVVRAFSDKYDANASSHRGGFDEGATTALRKVGEVAKAQDYEILIEGELPISYKK